MKSIWILPFLFYSSWTMSQDYTSYFTGNGNDVTTTPSGGVCLMGGATENDEAMKWFLNRSDGGDILILRTSGSDGYNDYFYTDLGTTVNSVETIVFNNSNAANDTYIHNKIQQAEAIWFAGGDQWNYISYWRGNTIGQLINEAVSDRNIVIGGTSAGMAILGQLYFSAENGTVTSNTALNNPYDNDVTIDNTPFLSIPYLENTITDTHYDNPDRKGRHAVFLARIFNDWGLDAKGIACEEYTAVCIAPDGIASVYGEYPEYDDFAYFLQVNCELEQSLPETCMANEPLTWNHDGQAIKAYQLPGTLNGSNTFDLNDWQTGIGGTWMEWSVLSGSLSEQMADGPSCTTSILEPDNHSHIRVFPNPNKDFISIQSESFPFNGLTIRNTLGQIVFEKDDLDTNQYGFQHQFPSGLYFVETSWKQNGQTESTQEMLLIQSRE